MSLKQYNEIRTDQLKNGQQKRTKAASVAPVDPEAIFQKLMQDVEGALDVLGQKLTSQLLLMHKQGDVSAYDDIRSKFDQHLRNQQQLLKQSTSPNPSTPPPVAPTQAPQQPQRQPRKWFGNGVKGFVSRLWHGESFDDRSLASFLRIEREINSGIDDLLLFEDELPLADGIKQLLDRFKGEINDLFRNAMVQLQTKTPASRKKADPNQPSLFDQPAEPAQAAPVPTEESENKSIAWLNSRLPVHDDTVPYEERLKNKQIRESLPSFFGTDRVVPGKEKEAIALMKSLKLNPCKVSDVRLLWPHHAAVGIGKCSVVKENEIIESILADCTPETREQYLKSLVQCGL